MTNNSTYRFPAEWEKSDAILLSWPHADTDWSYMLEKVTECYLNVVKAITRFMPVIIVAPQKETVTSCLPKDLMSKVTICETPTNDTWARDFGPITLLDYDNNPVLLDFKFNAWGLKFAADKDNLITKNLFENKYITGIYQNHLGFVLEGGSIETDGTGLLLTTSECLLSPNRNGDKSKSEIESYLKSTLNIKKVLWLNHGFLKGDDTDSHIDTLARLAPNNNILYVKCSNEKDIHFEELSKMEKELKTFTNTLNEPLTLVPLPLPDPIYEDGERLPATYANYLVTEKAVFVPVYGQQKDALALKQLQKVFPAKEIVPIDCNALICQHGSLHCITMQLYTK